ncbi:MAG: hypothetical protein AAF752_06390 [Bacteroidota bacterium]
MNAFTPRHYLFAPLPCVLLCVLLVAPVLAQTEATDAPTQPQIQAQVDSTMKHLDLTSEQEDPVRSILENSFTQRLATLEKHGLSPQALQQGERPGFRTRLRLKRDMDKLRSDTKKQLKAVLTDEQLTAWETLEASRQAQMRERMSGTN